MTIGVEEDLKGESAVTLDHVLTVEKARLFRYIGHVAPRKMRQVCHALAIAVACDE